MTLRQALAYARAEIKRIDPEQAEVQAEWLLMELLQTGRSALLMDLNKTLNSSQIDELQGFIKRRLQGEPVQYILGNTEFRYLKLQVDRRALIPRPETEGLVDIALQLLGAEKAPRICDIGTGSGVIALSLVHEHPGSSAVAVDISREALALAAVNAQATGLQAAIELLQADARSVGFYRMFKIPFDLIVSNPPYVTDAEYEALPDEIRLFEPAQALKAGQDGLEVLQALANQAGTILKSGHYLTSEIGENQAENTTAIFKAHGWEARVEKDLSQKERYLIARKP